MNLFGKLKYPLPTILFFTLSASILLYVLLSSSTKLPIYNATDFNAELVDTSVQGSLEKHTIANFHLINQNNEIVTQENYRNKIYVADFFFTRCPTICPIMANNMKKLQDEFLNEEDVMLLSMSVTPVLDSVPVLKKYSKRHSAIDTKWHITTGNKKQIYNLARKSFFAAVDQGDGGFQDFIHTPNFILIDKKKRIRGVYDGSNTNHLTQLTTDIKTLQGETP
ncbi:SCO family protein [Zobellia roscoffensis]